MNDTQRTFVPPTIVWPSIIVIVIGLYGYLTYKPPLISARPGASVTGETRIPPPNSRYARLWQDPLGPEYAEITKKVHDASKEIKNRDEFKPEKLAETAREQLKGIWDNEQHNNERLLVMPVFLPGGPSVDDRELRRRTRYAILAAFTTLHYRPQFSDRLYFFTLPSSSGGPLVVPFEVFFADLVDSVHDVDVDARFKKVLVCWLNESRLVPPADQVHYFLRSLFPNNSAKPEVRVLGPTNSDLLVALAKENSTRPENGGRSQFSRPITVYSPRATVTPNLLKNEAEHRLGIFLESPCTIDRVIRTVGTDFGLALALWRELSIRSALPEGDNDCIVLLTERDTLYGRAFPLGFRHVVGKAAKELLKPKMRRDILELVSKSRGSKLRQDIETALKRDEDNLVASIQGALANISDEEKSRLHREIEEVLERSEKQAEKQAKKQLLVFKYVRGMDGLLPSDTSPKVEDANNAKSKIASPQRSIEPVGRGQFDYLQRLAEHLVKLHKQKRQRGGRGICAIGVVGTDVYDKLLVLRALRARFPRTWFFTTDLDENFSRPTETDWCQNLLVASHFALTLCPYLQRDAPPFRDCYQTAYFLSTLIALEDSRVKKRLWGNWDRSLWPLVEDLSKTNTNLLTPLMFEIGRDGPYQLTTTGGEESLNKRIQPASSRDQRFFAEGHWKSLLAGTLVGGLAFALLAFYLTAVRKVAFAVYHALRRPVRWVYVFFGLAWQNSAGRRRTRRLQQRAPLFPLRIRWRLGKLRRALADLCCITQRYSPVTRTDFEILCIGGVLLSLIGVIFWDHRSSDGEPFELWAGISVWPTTILRFCAAVASIAFIRKGMRDLTASREQLCDAELSIDRRWLASNALLPRRGADRRFRIRDALRDIFAWKWERAGAISTRMLCRWYFHKGRSSYRFIRIATATLVYLGFVFCLFTFTDGFPNAPYRGWRSKVTGNVVLAFSVIFTTALVFFVMDAIQLCSRFIYSLSQQTIGWPQKAIALADKSRHERFSEDLRELLIIRVIAHRTNVVGKLLVFPFTVLLLMIASRHSGFDYWTAPVPLMAVLGLLLGGLVVSGLMMRREANKIRRQVLSRLREHLSIAISESQVKRKEQLEHLIDEIGRERSGAFRPITDDYVFRALAIPFGGAGSLLLLEQLLP